jgi:hypothetical protein
MGQSAGPVLVFVIVCDSVWRGITGSCKNRDGYKLDATSSLGGGFDVIKLSRGEGQGNAPLKFLRKQKNEKQTEMCE